MTPNTATPSQPYPSPTGIARDTAPAQPIARSFWHPRWPLLAAILYTPATLIGYAVKIYYLPHVCTFGRICQLDTLPSVAQVGFIWLGYLLLWALLFLFGRAIDGPVPPRPYTLAARLFAMSRHQPVRGLLAVFGLADVAGIVITTIEGRIDPAGFAMAAIVVFVAARVVSYTPPPIP
jgi:hypothetical protein